MKSYIRKIRNKIGQDKLIHPGARILIEDNEGQFLFIERVDNGLLGLPAGSLEENENIEDCIRREVREETGLELINLEMIGISTQPENETVIYPNGDVIQYFTIEFYSNEWENDIHVRDKQEIFLAEFKPKSYLNKLPDNEKSIVASLEYYRREGKVRIS